MDALKKYYSHQYNNADGLKDQIVKTFSESNLNRLQADYFNKQLEKEVLKIG